MANTAPQQQEVRPASVGDSTPIAALLSFALVAFTIECDNEYEHRMPHRTTVGGGKGPWLTSLVMWANCLQYIPVEGITVHDLQARARTDRLSLTGLQRWGYLEVAPAERGRRTKTPGPDWIVRLTQRGEIARQGRPPFLDLVERRWVERFGAADVAAVRHALAGLPLRNDLPDYLPIQFFSLYTQRPPDQRDVPTCAQPSVARLHTLLSRTLHSFALDYESNWDVSLSIVSNMLRVLGEEPVRVRDLPRLSGVSKEGLAMVTGYLEKRGMLTMEPDPAAERTKAARLTAAGLALRTACLDRIPATEAAWRHRYGDDAVARLREPLERLVGDGTAAGSPLFQGLTPYPDCWRAGVPKPETLPHYPMPLHRGGYPDGS